MSIEKNFLQNCNEAICRSCRSKGLKPILDLGEMPLADALVSAKQLNSPEQIYPLQLAFCEGCSLVQILETVEPEKLFTSDYPYYSSFSDALLEHSRKNAFELIDRLDLEWFSLVIEIASNDGYMLKNFVEKDIPVLGIDPASGPAGEAQKKGVKTLETFFTADLARRLVSDGSAGDLVLANNVLAHVADTNGFVEGIGILLKTSGMAVIEVPYLRRLIENCEFDTIYHEHLCYFSFTSLDRLFRRHGLYINDVRELDIHGGSLRIYVEKFQAVKTSVIKMLRDEKTLGMDKLEYYQGFASRVMDVKWELQHLLEDLKSQGRSIAAYGAAAKGAILLNYLQADSKLIDFVVDRNTHKQGKYMPGMHIPIKSPQLIREAKPDYVLMLPWNFRDEILAQCSDYRAHGGHFIIPIPKPEIV